MGYDLFGGLLFAALTPLVILGFVAFWLMTNRERANVEDTWESFAAARAHEYFPARGEWPNRRSPGVRWVKGAVTFELTAVGFEAGARTRLVAKPRERLLGSFALHFDGARLVSAERPAGLVERIFEIDPSARRALYAFRQYDDVTLRYRRGRLVLEWPGRETSHARLDEAARVTSTIADAIDHTFEAASRRIAS